MRKIAFLLMPAFSNLGLAAATEPLFVANWLLQDRAFTWVSVSLDGRPVVTSTGLAVPVDGDLSAADDAATIFVLASFEPQEAARSQPLLRWLRRRARFGAQIGGIETGTEVLAAAGLLDGRQAAVHWDNLRGFEERYPRVEAVPELFTLDTGRITCAGAAAILDMMIAWLAGQVTADVAGEVAAHLLLGRARAADTPQAGATGQASGGDPLVARAITLMQAHVEEPLSCAAIAARLGLSQRQVERRFRQDQGHSILRHYLLIRLGKAHQLLQQTELSVTNVAVSCGFASLEYFSRVYRGAFGISPSADRRQSVAAPVLRRR